MVYLYRFQVIIFPAIQNTVFFPLCRCGPTTGPGAACGPPQRFQWPAEAFPKNLQS